MALDKQIHMYSIDTGAFYYNKERKLYNKLFEIRNELFELKNKMNDVVAFLHSHGVDDDNIKSYDKGDLSFIDNYTDNSEAITTLLTERNHLKRCIAYKNAMINKIKKSLHQEFEVKCENSGCIRKLNTSFLNTKNIISVFESSLTRILNIDTNELTEDVIVIKVFYYEILKDLILNGFEYNGEKYRFFTASAGQIRTKKTVFIKETLWNKYMERLMCGLTIDKINSQGGINVNKFLAYLALINSATDLWVDFDIDKTIVVDDFETNVIGKVDLIDDETYQVKRVTIPVPITHTDGCGMILPRLSKKNFMIRLPWVKGLLTSFDYVKFIQENNYSPVVKDIYGKEWNIIEDDIQIIFTKSQFKMYNYYSSWEQYKQYFKDFKCQAGICNLEEDYIKNAKINYQMLQTLSDISKEELIEMCRLSNEKIEKISTTVESMLEVFGVTKYNNNKTYLQQALEIYPELLRDIYTKDVLREIKNSLIKNYKAGKIEIKGKYTFLVPDMYAFCEYLFLGDKNPKGLLKDGEVFCRLYKNVNKLDCLRSPHLYREHAVRNNVVDEEKSQWFTTDAIYTSCHDLISKILQFDVDGDRSLVVADELLVSIAERNMKDIVPLYYNMKKAKPVILTNEKIYEGLIAAYSGGNIGMISNDITKIWNSGKITDEKMKVIKILCMENNFVIDYAKTLYKPKRPDRVKKMISKYTKSKVPYFFQYAKNKKSYQVEPINNSIVNKLDKVIKNKRMTFSVKKFGRFNYQMLMSKNVNEVIVNQELIDKYIELNRKYHYKINREDENKINISYIATEIRSELSKFGYDDTSITDMLVLHLYGKINSKSKEALWFCYGDIIVENLKRNIGDKTSVCMRCGKRYKKDVSYQKYCDECAGYQPIGTKTIECVDCGKVVEVDAKNNESTRCNECYKVYRKNKVKENVKRYRERNKNNKM